MKKIKAVFYLMAVFWIVAGTQTVVNHFFMSDRRMIDAFADADYKIEQGSLELLADYGDRYLSGEDKRYLIRRIAASIGLTSYTPLETTDKNKTIVEVLTEGRDGDASIRVLTLRDGAGEKHYLSVKLDIYNRPDRILSCKKKLEACMEKLKAGSCRSYLTFISRQPGEVTMEEREKKTDGLLKSLQAVLVSENKSRKLYTVYAYTGLIKESIRAAGRKINVNLAVVYDEKKDVTSFYLATPVMNMDY